MSRRLRSRLLAIGRAAGTRSESGGIRFFALALASLTLALAVAAVVTALAVGSSRADRMAAGHFQPAGPSTAPESTVLVKPAIDHLRGGRQYVVVFLSPGGDGAPLPPGLASWPEPGAAVVSPELLRKGADQGISGRYGRIVGIIGEPGLADPTELLAYVRPARPPDSAVAVSGFGGSDTAVPGRNPHWLLADQDFLTGALPTLLVLLGLVPALLLALVAAGVAAHSRERRDALVTALGGRVAHRLWIALGEAWAPVSLGALGAVGVIAWFAAADRRLPIVDYVIPAADVRDQWWVSGLGTVAAAAFVLSAAVVRSAIGRVGDGPLRDLAARTRELRVRLFPCAILVAAWGPSLFATENPLHVLTAYAGLVGAVLTMPAAIGVGVGALGRALARWGRDG
ncbi:MAG: ABC transporter permease, partial [Saccharothrix sp.]|nr:ABC transporter permease [Saccharothrix sp.]